MALQWIECAVTYTVVVYARKMAVKTSPLTPDVVYVIYDVDTSLSHHCYHTYDGDLLS